MKFRKVDFVWKACLLFGLFYLLYSTMLIAQQGGNQTSPLEGLVIAAPGDIPPGTPIMLDPNKTPCFNDSLRRISAEEFPKYMMSNQYVPQPYLDAQKNIKAFVLRKATSEELQMMARFQEKGIDSEANALVGQKVKDFELKDVKGKELKFSDLEGKVVVLNFWFIECKPCLMEIPELNALVNEFQNQDVVFLAIALNSKNEVKGFLKEHKFMYQLYPDGPAVAEVFGIKGYPTNLIIDQKGIVQYVSTGIGPDNQFLLKKQISKALNH
jgi:peroxiredoxin